MASEPSLRRLALTVGVALALLLAPAGATTPAAGDAATGSASLHAAYPNPVERGDPGEFVVLELPPGANASRYVLTDGSWHTRLPAGTPSGRVAVSATPDRAAALTDAPVVGVDGRLRLANDGERLALRRGNRTVDVLEYREAPTARVWDAADGGWRPVGATGTTPVRAGGGRATAFVFPDGADRVVETLQAADERVLLAGYTFTSRRVTEALLAVNRSGVRVRVLLEGSPVDGMTSRQARMLGRLSSNGVAVRVLAGPYKRYEFHHPKYAVVDDRAMVLTENFKPAGTGGMSSRGWGVVLANPTVAAALADLHAADWTWRAATPWARYRVGRTFADSHPALGRFEPRHEPATVVVASSTVLVAPDNAASAVAERIDRARERVLVQQMTISSRENRLLRAALRAADRGVTVRIHLSGAWYVAEDNAALAAWLNRRADAAGWDLEARVDDPVGYAKIHTKGVVVDDTVLVGSLNWGRTALRENREVVLALTGEAVAGYYVGVFQADWASDGDRSLPPWLGGLSAVALAAATLLARRIEIVGRDGVATGWRS